MHGVGDFGLGGSRPMRLGFGLFGISGQRETWYTDCLEENRDKLEVEISLEN